MKVFYALLSILVVVAMFAASFFFVFYFDINEEGLALINGNIYLFHVIKVFYTVLVSVLIGATVGKLVFKLRQLRRSH